MSADPHSPPPPPEPVPPATGETPVETLPQKRRYKRPEAGDLPNPTDDSDDEIIVLSSLLQNLLARKQRGADASEAAEAEARSKINRFVARKDAPVAPVSSSPAEPPRDPGAPAAREPVPAEAAGPTDTAASPRQIGSPTGMAAIAFPKYEPRSFKPDPFDTWWHRSGSTWGRGILYFAFTAGLALAAFLAGRNDRHPADSSTEQATKGTSVGAVWAPTETGKLDQALMADQNGDLDTAHRIAGDLRKELKSNAPLDAYYSMLDTRDGRLNDVEADLSRRTGPGTPPEVATLLQEAQAFNYCRRREFDRAATCFGEVAKTRPFDAGNFLRWGEALRRSGSFVDAMARFQQALLRLPPTAPGVADEREYVAFKARLTQVEFSRGSELKETIAQHLIAPAPGGYWLLTGAAAALQGGDIPNAVDLLKKARATFPPAQFQALLDDYYFRTYADHPEITPFLSPTSPEKLRERRLRMEYFVDP